MSFPQQLGNKSYVAATQCVGALEPVLWLYIYKPIFIRGRQCMIVHEYVNKRVD